MKKILFILATAILMLTACNPKQQQINNLKSLTTKIESQSAQWDDIEWEEAINELEQIDLAMAEYDYTDEELQEIGRLQGRCYAKLVRQGLKDAAKETNDALNIFQGLLQGFSDEWNEE